MSQPPDAPDPYLPSPDGDPRSPYQQQPYQQQPYQQQPYQPPHPRQPWTGDPSDLTGRRSQDEVRRDRPATVARLIQLMWAGAVLAVLVGAYGLISLESVVTEATSQIEQDLVGTGLDPASFTQVMGPVAVVTILLSTLVTAGLWVLFAWLLGRGQGRVVATVLGGINAVATLVGLFVTADLIELALQLLTLLVIAGALVLLWLPSSSTWFREVKAAAPGAAWS